MPDSLIPELDTEIEAERLRRLRHRFLWFTGFSGFTALAFTTALAIGFLIETERATRIFSPGSLLTAISQSFIFLIPFAYTLRTRARLSRKQIIRTVTVIVALATLIEVIPARESAAILSEVLRSMGIESHLGIGVPMVLRAFIFYTAAACFIPWTPREAIIPILPLIILQNGLLVLSAATGHDSFRELPLSLLASAVLPLPGILICAVRNSRFRITFTNRALQDRFAQIADELAVARRIHERLFPAAVGRGPVHLEYAYEPMREIGGDFLFAREGPATDSRPGWFSLVLIDVTGHGIAAALAVNRLHGELERLFGTVEDPAPGLILAELNRYMHFAMASESVYATAIALRVDLAASVIRWASAAHPPAILATAGGPSVSLKATTFLLGVSTGDEFDAAEESSPFPPGSSLLAYTDGAFELRLAGGRMLGLEGLSALTARHRGATSWSQAILADLNTQREGPPADDILIVQVSRPS